MASFEQAKKFWKTTKEVSVTAIAREAQKPVSVAIVGAPEHRAEVIRHLFPHVDTDSETVIPERSLVRAYDSTAAEAGFPATSADDIIIDAGGGRSEAPIGAPVYSVEELGGWDRVAHRILDQRPDLALTLARRFPGLRRAVAEKVTRDAALANAEFAMLNAIPGVIPITAPLLPAAAIGDIFVLTKNQAMMLYKLAAIYELPLDLRSRSRDLAPLLGNAFGWRAIAREVVGAVPGGAGLIAKGAIAYAGTIALGKALERLYETGVPASRATVIRFYKEAYAGARDVVRERLRAIQGRSRPAVGFKKISAAELPPAEESVADEEDGS